MTETPPMPDSADDPITRRLAAARPAPRAGYRGALRRRLVALGPPAARPAHLHRLVALHAGGGLLLLAAGVASAAGLGPLAA